MATATEVAVGWDQVPTSYLAADRRDLALDYCYAVARDPEGVEQHQHAIVVSEQLAEFRAYVAKLAAKPFSPANATAAHSAEQALAQFQRSAAPVHSALAGGMVARREAAERWLSNVALLADADDLAANAPQLLDLCLAVNRDDTYGWRAWSDSQAQQRLQRDLAAMREAS